MNDNKSIRPVLTEDEQKQVDEYFNFAAMSTEEKKPFLTEDDREIIGREKYGYWDDISVRDRISRGHFESGYNTAATKANAKIAELEKENESLKYWKAERDEEAEAERVSIAVAEIEIEKQEATKEEQKEWFSAGGMAERIIWKDKIEELESEVKKLEAWSKKQNDFIDKLGQENQKLREERDRFAIDFAKHFYLLTPTQRCTVHPPAGSGAGYGLYQRDISDILEQFKQQSK